MKTRKVSRTLLNVMRRLTTTACAAAILFAIASVSRAEVLLHYKLDETTGTSAADSGPNSHTGALNAMNFDSHSVAGVHGTALDFGTNADNRRISVPDIGISNTDALTVMAWLKPTDWNVRGIWLAHQFGDITITAGIQDKLDGVMLFRYINANAAVDSMAEVSTKDPAKINLPDNTYAHFAFTMDPSGIDTIFVNGNPATPNNTTNGWGASGTNASDIGRRLSGTGNRDYHGAMDDYVVFGRKLGQSEIQDIMNNGVPEPTTMTLMLMGLCVGFWAPFHRRRRRRN